MVPNSLSNLLIFGRLGFGMFLEPEAIGIHLEFFSRTCYFLSSLWRGKGFEGPFKALKFIKNTSCPLVLFLWAVRPKMSRERFLRH